MRPGPPGRGSLIARGRWAIASRRRRALIHEMIATTCTADDAAPSAASRLVSAFAVDGFNFRSAPDSDASSSAETDRSTD